VPGSTALSTIADANAASREPQRKDEAGRSGTGDQDIGIGHTHAS